MVKRYDCLKFLVNKLDNELVVTTLGATAHEWGNLSGRDADLYLMGMGLVTATGLGLAMALPRRRVLVLDSDGSLLMCPSVFSALAGKKPKNLLVICFDNQCYNAVGGYPTATASVADIAAMAKAAGLTLASTVSTGDDFEREVSAGLKEEGPRLIVVKTDRWNAPVPPLDIDGPENKYRFARHIEKTEGIKIFAAIKS
jgi:thiamine pyrophosphate-dependent acetolactate synthase large subunit-like protein